jgi:hypothetical protein
MCRPRVCKVGPWPTHRRARTAAAERRCPGADLLHRASRQKKHEQDRKLSLNGTEVLTKSGKSDSKRATVENVSSANRAHSQIDAPFFS